MSSLIGKCLKFNVDFKNQKKIEKKFLVFQIIASDLAALNRLHYEGNTCRGQSMR